VDDINTDLATHAFLEDDPEKIYKASGEKAGMVIKENQILYFRLRL